LQRNTFGARPALARPTGADPAARVGCSSERARPALSTGGQGLIALSAYCTARPDPKLSYAQVGWVKCEYAIGVAEETAGIVLEDLSDS
jgi:hypothetical protein